MGPEIAAAASIGSLALNAAEPAIKGFGEKAGQDFMAGQAERAAALGRVKAEQTDTALREELNTTLGNIDVIRAAAGTDPFSPTAMAIKDKEAAVSERNRRIAVSNITAQADERALEAKYRNRAGNLALLGGLAGSASRVLKGASSYKG